MRVPSLRDLGLTPDQISSVGTRILNWQMGGLLLGGILWGVLGDKRGRLSVLFGSIFTYSVANLACVFIKHVTFMDPVSYYALMRFVAGLGLAGELGVSITLVSELLPTRQRAIGTSLVAGIGILGAVVAYFTVKLLDWQLAFFTGGALGISILMLRVGVIESGMFTDVKGQRSISRGNFLAFFTNRNRLGRYLKCIAIGLPTWFVIGVLATFSNEFGQAFGLTQDVQPGLAILWSYVGLAAGDLSSGLISQYLASRRKAVALLMGLALMGCLVFLYVGINSTVQLYSLCLVMGVGIGYWALFVTIGAEQFGTNLRATAATTVPNMVRGLVIPMTLSYQALKPSLNVINAGAVVGLICFLLGFYAILTIPETHNRELDFLEE